MVTSEKVQESMAHSFILMAVKAQFHESEESRVKGIRRMESIALDWSFQHSFHETWTCFPDVQSYLQQYPDRTNSFFDEVIQRFPQHNLTQESLWELVCP